MLFTSAIGLIVGVSIASDGMPTRRQASLQPYHKNDNEKVIFF